MTDRHTLNETILSELRAAVGALIATLPSAAPATMAGRVWTLQFLLEGEHVTLAFDHLGAVALTKAVTSLSDDPGATVVSSTLGELCAQVARGVGRALGTGAAIEVSAAESVDWNDSTEAMAWALSAPALERAVICAFFPSLATRDGLRETRATESRSSDTDDEPSAQDRLAVILDIDLPLVVRFGCTSMPLKAVARLGPGSLIDLGRAPDDPVEVLVSNRVVAHGEVVVVAGSYGIRILDVVSPRDRLNTLEA